MNVVSISEILRLIAQLAALAQSSSSSGVPIPKEEFDATVAGRNEALNRLDASIARAREEGR